MTSISADIELAILSSSTALFKRYGNYYANRISHDTFKPLPEPVIKFAEALVLLYEGMSDCTQRRLKLNGRLPDGSFGPVIRIDVLDAHHNKHEIADSYEIPISNVLAEYLQKTGILSAVPYEGCINETELRLNEFSTLPILEEIHKFGSARH